MIELVSLYQQRLNLQDATFSRIEHDDAMVAIVCKVMLPTGTHLILKICKRPNDCLREVYFLKYFSERLPVPRILQVVEPQEGVDGAVLMECLPGTLLKITDYTDELAYAMGSLLARMHLNRAVSYGDLIHPNDLSPDPCVYFTQKFEEGFSECSNNLPKSLLEQCRCYYDAHLSLLASVDGPCIVHRDFRPGNLMVYEGKFQGIIDWSSGRAGFAQEDFCSLEHEAWPFHPEKKKSFLAGYASIRSVPDYSTVMPLLRLSKAISTIGFTVKSGIWNSSHMHLYQFNRQFLETFF